MTAEEEGMKTCGGTDGVFRDHSGNLMIVAPSLWHKSTVKNTKSVESSTPTRLGKIVFKVLKINFHTSDSM